MKILLADDQAEIRMGLRMLLEQENEMDISGEASDTEELLELMKKLQPDLLLLDWELPGISRIDAVPHLRKLSAKTKIIALSGLPEAKSAANLSGVDSFVSKGDRPDTILNTINKIFGGE